MGSYTDHNAEKLELRRFNIGIGAILCYSLGLGLFASAPRYSSNEKTAASINAGKASGIVAELPGMPLIPPESAEAIQGGILIETGVAERQGESRAPATDGGLALSETSQSPNADVFSSDPIEFDLSDTLAVRAPRSARERSSGELINVRKPIFSGGNSLGSVTVEIDQFSQIFIKAGDIQKLLAETGSSKALVSKIDQESTVSFQRLRELGVDLKYDPLEDRIVLN